MHNERSNKHKTDDDVQEGAVPAYLMDREGTSRAKILSNTLKQKRKEKAGKWDVPVPKVRPVADDEMFKVLRSGKRKSKLLWIWLWAIRMVMVGSHVFWRCFRKDVEAHGYKGHFCWSIVHTKTS